MHKRRVVKGWPFTTFCGMMKRNYNDRRRDELHTEYSRLSRQKTYAWVLVVVAGFLLVSNFLGVHEPTNHTLGALCLMGLVGGIWLHTVRGELARNRRRSVENNRELDEMARLRDQESTRRSS
jgi:hypothetical protein